MALDYLSASTSLALCTLFLFRVSNAFCFDSQGEDGVPGEDGRKVCDCSYGLLNCLAIKE